MQEKFEKGKVFTVPNILSIFRILLVPLFMIAFFCWSQSQNYIVAMIIFLVASFTDLLDGIIARETNQISSLGMVLDPLADKLLKMGALICFTVVNIIPVWFTVVLIVLDFAMIVTGLILYEFKISIPSNIFGKMGTFTMFVGFLLCFFNETVYPWNMCVLYAGLIIIIISIIVYIVVNKDKVFSKRKIDRKKVSIDKNDN